MERIKRILIVVVFFIPIMLFFPGCSCSSGGDNDTTSDTTYTVTFYTGSHVTFNIDPQEVKDGGRVIEPKRPSMFESNRNENDEIDGHIYVYSFVGWYEDSAFTKLWLFSNEVHGDITLFAKWDIRSK